LWLFSATSRGIGYGYEAVRIRVKLTVGAINTATTTYAETSKVQILIICLREKTETCGLFLFAKSWM
jgi:hypothetical protein